MYFLVTTKPIVYPFYGSLTSFDDIFDIPNNDSVKFDIYKNSENKEILKITINLTIVPGVQNIYTNIERSTKDKKKVTFSFQVEASFWWIIASIIILLIINFFISLIFNNKNNCFIDLRAE